MHFPVHTTLDWLARHTATLFFILLLCIVTCNTVSLFFVKRPRRSHAITGLVYLTLLSMGYLDCMGISNVGPHGRLLFDIALGVAGIFLTLSAAADFSHKGVVNMASGTLDQHATVTHGEMIEHSFYQGLNLVQVCYLHASAALSSLSSLSPSPQALGTSKLGAAVFPLALLLAATLPWAARSAFPINRFSDNYNKLDPKSSALIRWMYRAKKYQYVFYKCYLLHGLNISRALVSISASTGPAELPESLPLSPTWRLYWLLLNTAYVMEFFLQTLVKKGYLSQPSMLVCNALLMVASTCAALPIISSVLPMAAALSLVLNFLWRGNDVVNTLIAFGLLYLYREYQP